MYCSYADAAYYREEYAGELIPDEILEKKLKEASRHMDSLTYNRIVGRGIAGLTAFQQEIIRETCCKLAEFEYENADMINSVLQSYSINGVTMNFGESWNVKVVNGIVIKQDIYTFLCQSGLCCTSLGVR